MRACAALLAITLLACGGATARAPHDATSHRTFDDVEHWVRVFDDPARDEWQKPAAVAEALGLEPGETVVDLGAGTGYFVPHLVRAVGPTGTVLAVEPEPKLVEHLRARAEQAGWTNVVPVLASADNPRVPRGTADVVLVVDTYHHIDDRLSYLRRLRDVLTSTGRVVIIDWQKRPLPVGPALDHKLARAHVEDEMRKAGYRLDAAPALLPYQYFLIFAPAAR